ESATDCDPAGFQVLPAPVALGQGGHRDVATGPWRMQELAIADVDAALVAAATASKAHQVALGQCIAVGDWRAFMGHRPRHPRQVDADGAEYVTHQAAAVEAVVRAGTAPAVRRTKQREGALQHGLDA